MTGSWAEIFALLKAWRWRELLYKPTENGTLQFLRYLIVGGCAFLADFCTVWLLKELGLHYLVAGVFGFIQAWNEFTLALVVMTREDQRTRPLWLLQNPPARSTIRCFSTAAWASARLI